jgi:hypothetical protein
VIARVYQHATAVPYVDPGAHIRGSDAAPARHSALLVHRFPKKYRLTHENVRMAFRR